MGGRGGRAGPSLLKPLQLQGLEYHPFVKRLAYALLHLPYEVPLKPDLGVVHPSAFLRPGDVPRRELRDSHEGYAGVSHVGEADSVPGRPRSGDLPSERRRYVMHGRADHALYHIAGLGNPYGDGCRLRRGYRDAYAHRIDVLVSGRPLE